MTVTSRKTHFTISKVRHSIKKISHLQRAALQCHPLACIPLLLLVLILSDFMEAKPEMPLLNNPAACGLFGPLC